MDSSSSWELRNLRYRSIMSLFIFCPHHGVLLYVLDENSHSPGCLIGPLNNKLSIGASPALLKVERWGTMTSLCW